MGKLFGRKKGDKKSDENHDGTGKYVVNVKTRDIKHAGTDNTVSCVFYADNGKQTNNFTLDKCFVDDMEKGKEEVFEFSEDDIGNIDKMEICLTSHSNSKDKWFCEYVIVSFDKGDGKKATEYPFPIHRWIKANKQYEFELYNCSLPQDVVSEQQKQQRKEEIEENRKEYVFKRESEGMPRTTETLPEQEVFSSNYQFDIIKRAIKLKAMEIIEELLSFSNKWTDFDSMKALFKGYFSVPRGYHQWNLDLHFGEQRLNGVNMNQIKICKKVPSNFPVTDDMVGNFLEGLTLIKAASKKRLYIVDHKELEDCPQNKKAAPMCCPLALFFVTKLGDLIPIAIQLFQEASKENPIFLPSDPEYTWMLAKMFFNNADAQVHQATTHLAFTHLACESIGVAVHQSMSTSHPVYQLLAPHFLYVYAINHLAVTALMAPGAFFDKNMQIGHIGLRVLIGRKWSKWRMDREGWFPADIEYRGVNDEDALPHYYSRDDESLLHQAIWNYVREVLTDVYDNQAKLKGDREVQEFARLLVDKDGCGINGVFGRGKFKNLEDLIKVVTATIFMASVTHAAVNFGQYDQYGFGPNCPMLLYGDVPKNKSERTMEDILSHFPHKDQTLDIMVFSDLLSSMATDSLGHFDIEYMYRPTLQEAVKRFQDKLKEVGDKIDARNRRVRRPYTYLEPKNVPNAISI